MSPEPNTVKERLSESTFPCALKSPEPFTTTEVKSGEVI